MAVAVKLRPGQGSAVSLYTTQTACLHIPAPNAGRCAAGTGENAVRTHRQLHVEDCRNSDVYSGAVLGRFYKPVLNLVLPPSSL
jgi:hypothetical protein